MGDERTDLGGAPAGEGRGTDRWEESEPPPAPSEPPSQEPVPPAPVERAAPPARPSAWLRFTQWLSDNQEELWIVGSLAALGVVVRVLWLTEIETWGDAAQKWQFARQLLNGNDFGKGVEWSHHMARFGLNLPVALVQAVFGDSVRAYYIVPVAAHVLSGVMVYVIARRVSGRAAGVCCALLWIFFRGTIRSSSQLLPDGIAGFPLLLVTYCLIRLEERPARPLRWLVGASLAFVWVAQIKESNLILVPGLALAVWLIRRRFGDVLLCGGIVAGAALLDTAYFALHTDYAHRMAIVQEAHGELSVGFWELFDRILELEPSWQMLFWLWVPSVLWMAGAQDKRLRPLVIVPVVFVLLLTFMVRRVDPIVLWVSFKSRYFAAVAPLWVLGIGLFAVELGRRAWARHAREGWRLVPEHFARRSSEWTLALCTVLGLGLYVSERGSFDGHPLVRERRKAAIVNDAYRRNLPIIEYASNPRGLETLYAIHVKDEYLLQGKAAEAGHLPGYLEAVYAASRSRSRDSFSYLLRDSDAYTRRQLKRAVRTGCAVVVKARGRVLLTTTSKLPSHCKAPRGRELPR